MKTFTLLNNPRIAVLGGSGLIAEVGDWMLQIALPLYVLNLTGSPFVAATVFVLGLVPTIVAGPLAGVLIDRTEPWRLMATVALLQAAVLVPLLAVHGPAQLWIIYAVVIVQSTLGTIIEPCRATTAASLVAESELINVNQLMGLLSSVARLIGSPLGGLILAFGGLRGILFANIAVFLASSLLFAAGIRKRARPRSNQTGASNRPWKDLTDGLKVIATTPILRRTMGVVSCMALAQGAFVLLFVLFVVRDLNGTEADVGVLRGVQAIGALVGGGLLGLVVDRVTATRLMTLSLAAFGLLSLLIWNTPNFTTAFGVFVGLFIIVGVPGIGVMTGFLTVLQSNSPPAARGRVISTFFAVFGAMQALGTMLAGLVGTGIGLTIALQIQGGLYLIAALLTLRVSKPPGNPMQP